MPPRRIEPIPAEIAEALDGVEAAANGKTADDFATDRLLRRGVERGIEIISEAARHIPDDLLEAAPEIPWKQIRGIGKISRHEYRKTSDSIVWAVVTETLPLPRQAIQRIGQASTAREN